VFAYGHFFWPHRRVAAGRTDAGRGCSGPRPAPPCRARAGPAGVRGRCAATRAAIRCRDYREPIRPGPPSGRAAMSSHPVREPPPWMPVSRCPACPPNRGRLKHPWSFSRRETPRAFSLTSILSPLGEEASHMSLCTSVAKFPVPAAIPGAPVGIPLCRAALPFCPGCIPFAGAALPFRPGSIPSAGVALPFPPGSIPLGGVAIPFRPGCLPFGGAALPFRPGSIPFRAG
jgi:hypothetical protein